MKKSVLLFGLFSFFVAGIYAEDVIGSKVEGNPNLAGTKDLRDISQEISNSPDINLSNSDGSFDSVDNYDSKLYSEIMLQPAYIPGSDARLQLVYIENETAAAEFKVFYGSGLSRGLIFPQSRFTINQEVVLVQSTPVQLLCTKGSYLSIYVQDDGFASGEVDDGFIGPFYISMWLKYPQVSQQEKLTVRYQVKEGSLGKIGLKIGSKGECQIVALEGVKLF